LLIFEAPGDPMQSYQLLIRLAKTSEINIGKLGRFRFSAGDYLYTGSAKINMDSRIERHRSKKKKKHWHIDYFLDSANAEVVAVEKFVLEECVLNQQTDGTILASGFGSSDCRKKCGSHLKFMS